MGMLVACVGVICTLAGTRRAGMLVVFAGVYRLFLIQRPGEQSWSAKRTGMLNGRSGCSRWVSWHA